MKTSNFLLGIALLFFNSCHKAVESGTQTQTYYSLEAEVISDFTNGTVYTRYSSLLTSTVTMQDAVSLLVASTTDNNPINARTGWNYDRPRFYRTSIERSAYPSVF